MAGHKEGEQLRFPKESFPQEKKHRGRLIGGVTRSLFPLLILGLAGFGYWNVVKEIADRSQSEPGSTPPKREKGIEGLESYYFPEGATDVDNESIKGLLTSNWLLARTAFDNFAEYKLKTDFSRQTLDFIKGERWSLLVDGASAINRITGGEVFQISDEGRIRVTEHNLIFNFGNTYQEFLLDEIIGRMMIINSTYYPKGDKIIAGQELPDILWLAQKELPIRIVEGTFAFPPPDLLINLARLYKIIEELGYPFPKQITLKPSSSSDPGGAWYESHTDSTVGTDRIDAWVMIHEEAHHQADENEKFSQAIFNAVFKDALGKVGKTYFDSPDFYIRPPDFGKTEGGILAEDYANTLAEFFVNGQSFRWRLKKLYLAENPAYEVLRIKYEFARDFFEGREYLFNGEIFAPVPGDIFVIRDPDGFQRGIPLREGPTPVVTGETPQVFDGERVVIHEGPSYRFFERTGRWEEMWRVSRVFLLGDGSYKVGPETGWMWKIWLGDKIVAEGVGFSN